ncbi:MAG: tail fiber domain-containing protein [Chitinophagales bacterium]|nr:tail fiber domain-containing protein [Chitinophagales bacterium]
MKTIQKLLIVTMIQIVSIVVDQLHAQSTILGNALSGTAPQPSEFLGSNNNYDVEFRANNTPQMRILQSNGFVGIGNSFTNPSYRLDVNQGDINLNQTSATVSEAYRIGGSRVLWHNNNTSNLFVGVGAGANNTNTTGVNNTFVGYNAGNSNTSGFSNTFTGRDAGFSNTSGMWNTFNGDSTGYNNTTGRQNTFVGHVAGFHNTTGYKNNFVGDSAGFNNTTGVSNWFGGVRCGLSNTTGSWNTFTGHRSGESNTTGNFNCFYGKEAGPSNTFGADNCFYGVLSGWHSINGFRNCFFGNYSGSNNEDGFDNVFVGFSSGANCIGGSRNIAIGLGAGELVGAVNDDEDNVIIGTQAGATTQGNFNVLIGGLANSVNSSLLTNATAIGFRAFVAQSNSLVLGSINGINGATANTNVGIGITAPAARLDVNNTTEPLGVRVASAPAGINFPSIQGFGGFIGVGSRTQSAGVNIGGAFEANGAAFLNIGVYASAAQGNPLITNPIAPAGFFQGNVYASGDFFPNGSDVKLKDSIQNISNALSTIISLLPKQYVFKTDSFPYMNLAQGKHYGLVAQQVDTVLPELVRELIQPSIRDTSGTLLMDTFTFKAVNYTGLIPLTIAAIQELDSIAATKVGVCGLPGSTPAHYLPKWDSLNRVLCNSIVHDNGTAVGIPAAQAGSYFTVSNSTDTVAAAFSSTDSNTVAVVKAVYNTNTSNTGTAAVYGYSNYSNGGDADGIGGNFTGGRHGVYGLAAGNTNQLAGILGEAQGAAFMNIGVMGKSADTTDHYNVGVLGNTEGSEQVNVGTGGISEFANSTSVNLGVVGIAGGSQYENIGGNFEASDTVGLNYGVYAAVQDTSDYAGYFNGDVHIVGALTRGSDAKLKNNLQNIAADSSLAWLRKLEPKTYTYRREDYPSLTLPAGVQYGFTAQEVEKVLPHLVKDVIRPETRDLKGNITGQRVEYKGVDYLGFVPLLVGALKAQETKIEKQQTQIDSLKEVITDRLASIEQRLNGCCPTGASFKTDEGETAENKINVELSNLQVIVLEQNVPNPFAEQTSISYYIPENINGAQIVFTDVLGTVIKTADIRSGYGTVTVFAQNLSSGQYSYSLVVEGRVVESKKMVKQR